MADNGLYARIKKVGFAPLIIFAVTPLILSLSPFPYLQESGEKAGMLLKIPGI